MNKILTVSQLNNYVKNVFDDELLLQNITVEGEVYEAKFSGGNTYITLKEDEYVLSCVKFGSRFEFSVGDKVHANGSMRFYPRGGRTTFVITYASAVGKGDLLVKFNELKDKLNKEGVFNNTKPLPRFIKRIALVTSVEGAVIHDFLEVLTRNGCGYIDIDVYGVKVQGAGADESIVKAISIAAGRNYDVMVVARGGGSGQDLSCFNTEAVARGVFGCAYPVISAIGHEVDYTLCDFASSLRAGTPSIAAEQIVRINEMFISRFYERLAALKFYVDGQINAMSIRVKSLSADLMIGSLRKASELKNRMSAYMNRIYNLNLEKGLAIDKAYRSHIKTIYHNAEVLLTSREQELKYISAVLDKSSPLKILSDGYAKVLKDGNSVDNISKVNIGDKLKVVLSGGALGVTVTDKE
ncbi:MAG: exodeoxyribonuclease VII large subunit [Clostridiales bacterium]|nr:exodeoxyribonuclease VII large subunit [Clostridiales bacterium]